MSRRPERTGGSGRAAFLPCVWMSAGLLAYRLCDRDYDCDACPLDAAMRGGPQGCRTSGRVRAGDDAVLTFPDDRRYHRAHTWAQRLDPRTIRIGVDALAARLLGHPASLILPVPGSCLERGRTACWVVDGPELVALRAPVGGNVRRGNAALRTDPGLVGCSPYERGWLLDVERDDGAAALRGLLGADRIETRSRAQLRKLADRIATRLRGEGAALGPTLQDGGLPLVDLRRILGGGAYLRLVRKLLR